MKAGEIGVSLPSLDKVGKLQEALSAKAKRSPGSRFCSLYDKVYRHDVVDQPDVTVESLPRNHW